MDERGMTGARADAIELLVADHRGFEQQLDLLLKTDVTDLEVREHLSRELIRGLIEHSVAEEEVLYPAMRDVLPNGDSLADDGIKEHQAVEVLLTEIEKIDAASQHFVDTWTKIRKDLAHHISDEEDKDFPELRRRVDEERLMQMGDALAEAKSKAPTHPHPHAPSKPPFNVVANAGAALMDRLRDKADENQ
ncbi:MAG TPA: hemerythrin domain-containing protein [Acidimicrobiales bacterium]|nr:hemerythrin domain-containing protein [Acidimicrobiales bacterium]